MCTKQHLIGIDTVSFNMPRVKKYPLIKGEPKTVWVNGIKIIKYGYSKCGKCKGICQVATVDDVTEGKRSRVKVAFFCKTCKIVFPFKKKEIFTS